MPTFKPKVWREKERLDGEIVDCLTIILRTRGCAWNACRMCSYARESYPASDKELIEQIDYALRERADVVKIFTSGSFFDDREVPENVREYVRKKVKKIGVRKLIVESRPEFIDDEKLAAFENFNLEIGIGLETADDYVRDICINKGFTFADFKRAAEKIKEFGFRVKCYLLLKPPFLSESEAIDDILNSIEKVGDLADVFSINLTNVQKGTLVEKLWKAKLYRPPWLWSAVEVLRNVEDVEVICDPVAAGKARGPHNCGKCDGRFAKAIKTFSLTQNKSDLEVDCICHQKWKKALELEKYSRVPLWD